MSLRAGEGPDVQPVRGERATALVNVARSVQSRLNSVLAAGLVLAVGAAALAWYYSHALTRPARARLAAQAVSTTHAQGEMPLPALGRIEPPGPPAPIGAAAGEPMLASAAPEPLAELRAVATAGSGAPVPLQKPQRQPFERRLAGAVFARTGESGAAAATSESRAMAEPPTPVAAGVPQVGAAAASPLGSLLQPSATDAAAARRLPSTRLLLPKGAFIDCTLETAIDSTLPGMTTCVTATDTFSADGKVVLLERGTKLVGETQGQVRQGQARVFVLWTQARTPAGVVVPLDSPGTDELGRAGLAGEVQRHFWERFGAAMLVSLVDGAVQAGVQASSRAGATVIYSPAGSQDMLTEALKDGLHVAPTIVKRNGDRIQVLVARDLDFRPVYELRAAPGL